MTGLDDRERPQLLSFKSNTDFIKHLLVLKKDTMQESEYHKEQFKCTLKWTKLSYPCICIDRIGVVEKNIKNKKYLILSKHKNTPTGTWYNGI